MVSVCPHNCPPDSDAGCLLESAPLTTQSHLQSWLKSAHQMLMALMAWTKKQLASNCLHRCPLDNPNWGSGQFNQNANSHIIRIHSSTPDVCDCCHVIANQAKQSWGRFGVCQRTWQTWYLSMPNRTMYKKCDSNPLTWWRVPIT